MMIEAKYLHNLNSSCTIFWDEWFPSVHFQSRGNQVPCRRLGTNRPRQTHESFTTSELWKFGSKISWELEFFHAWRFQWDQAALGSPRRHWPDWLLETTKEWIADSVFDSTQTSERASVSCISLTPQTRRLSPRISPPKLGSMFLWTACARGFLLLHRELGSYRFYNYSNSTIFHHVFNESTKTDFTS